MKVIWSKRDLNVVRKTSRYIKDNFGLKAQTKFLNEISHADSLLQTNPQIGKIEPLLDDLPEMYRSLLITHLNKVVYRMDGDDIYIVTVWDARRDPITLAEQLN
jgi:plasmid stabilization system protein ParE